MDDDRSAKRPPRRRRRRQPRAPTRRSTWPPGTSTRRWSTCCGSSGSTSSTRRRRAPTSTTPSGRALPRLPHRRGVRQPRPQPPRRARGAARRRSTPNSSTACRSTTRRWPGCSPRRCRAAAGRARRGVLRQHRRRGGRLRDEVRARGDQPPAAAVVRQQLPRGHARAAVDRRRRVLQGGLRAAAARLRAGSVRRPRAARGRAGAKDVAAFIVEPIQGRKVTLPPEGYLGPPRSSAAATARCS